MRIVSWNIRAGGGIRAAQIAKQLESWRPSVVVLCEFRGTPPSQAIASRLTQLGLPHQRSTVAHDSPATNALLVASRWPLRRFTVQAPPDEPCRWLSVRVDAPQPFTLGAVHIPTRGTGRKYAFHEAIVSVAARWKRRPALIVGDTNTGRPEIDEEVPCFGPRDEFFLDSIQDLGWADAFRHTHGHERAYSWYSPNRGNGFRLDQAFLNRAFLDRLHDARYEWAGGRVGGMSDHAALLVDLSEHPPNAKNLSQKSPRSR